MKVDPSKMDPKTRAAIAKVAKSFGYPATDEGLTEYIAYQHSRQMNVSIERAREIVSR